MLDDMEKTISMAELARNTERIAKDIEAKGTVYRIKRPGHSTMMLMDDQYLDRWRATFEFMAVHPNWKQELAQARQEYRDGKYIPLEAVLKELGLEDRPPKTKRRGPARRNARARRTKAR